MSLSDSDTSSLSSVPTTDDEMSLDFDATPPITKYFKEESPSPPPKRSPSPPHEYVLADNPDIAFIVMFRARFSDVFPKSVPHFGPQDIERGVEGPTPGENVEKLLCALIGLVLNRKKEVERGHYQRALEDAIAAHSSQWPRAWEGKNPLRGGKTFATMSPEERLSLLRALILWSLSSSEAVQAKIKECYKQQRQEGDLNQPLSVQPWGRDDLKRRYWLIEGQDDTYFRLYRESNPALKNHTWWSVAGSIPELKSVAEKLAKEKSQHSKKLSEKIMMAIPRFEAGEERRKRREYRQARKAMFARPEPGFSLYEGRTRGKRLKYTFSDDEDIFSDDTRPTRRSARNAAASSSGEPSGPVYTASGRRVRTRYGGIYGESLVGSGQRSDGDAAESVELSETGRPRRSTRATRANGFSSDFLDDIRDDSEPEPEPEGDDEWKGDDESGDEFEGDDDENSGDADSMMDDVGGKRSLVVQLRYGKGRDILGQRQNTANGTEGVHAGDVPMTAGAEPAAAVNEGVPQQEGKPLRPEQKTLEVVGAHIPVPTKTTEASNDQSEAMVTDSGQDQSQTGINDHAGPPPPPSSPSKLQNGGLQAGTTQ